MYSKLTYAIFQCLDIQSDNQRAAQEELAENVNSRLEKAMENIKEKYRQGTNEPDHPDRAPTGSPYKIAAAQQQAQYQQIKMDHGAALMAQQVAPKLGDDDYDYLLDDDPDLDAIREQRIEEMKKLQAQRAENLAKGHGQVRTISQDEFLPECTSSDYVCVHFFHKEFQRCEIMDHHLKIIAPSHLTCKFVRIDAEKAPFFVGKLNIKTLPTLLVFKSGKTIARILGFEGLSTDSEKPDEWKTHQLLSWLSKTGAITLSADESAESVEETSLGRRHGKIRSKITIYDEQNQ